MEMVFEFFEGQPVPLLPRNGDGTPRIPDGVRFYNLQQAAARSGRTVESLRAQWMATCEPLLKFDDSSRVAEPTPAELAAEAGAASDAVTLTRLDLLHNIRFPDLTHEEFQIVQQECRERGLNIFTRDVAAVVTVDERGRRKVEVITTIAAFRKIGERNGRLRETLPQWCGRDGVWKDVWTSSEPPYIARVGVYRAGVEEPQYGEAYWDLCCQYMLTPSGEVALDENGPVLADAWRKGGPFMLGKCASAAAHRAAFAELGNVHTFDERRPGVQREAGAGTVSGRAARAGAVAADPGRVDNVDDILVDDSTPTTEHGFHLELMELNFNKPEARATLVRQMEARFPNLHQRNPVRFYALVLHTVRPDPQAWGAEAADAA